MYMIFVSIPLLLISTLWNRVNFRFKVLISVLSVIWLSTAFSIFYLNGNDWSIYFLSFVDGGAPFSIFEFGFVYFFKFLLYLSFGDFGTSILLFYLISFFILSFALFKVNCNQPYFFAFIVLVFGYSLILEQLRQYIACIIVFYSFLCFVYLQKGYLRWVIVASCFHASAIAIVPMFLLMRIKNEKLFSLISLLLAIVLFLFIFLSSHVFSSFSSYNFVFEKINYYLSSHGILLKFGFLNILDFIFILAYFLNVIYGNVKYKDNLLVRLIYLGAIIHLFSSSIPFLVRISYYFYFVVVLYFSLQKNIFSRFLCLKLFRAYCLFFFFIVLNLASYFRNPNAPISFYQLEVNFSYIFYDNNRLHNLAQEKWLSSIEDKGLR
ncbi:EpsG family protein [Yersinia aldovae]|uniref:Wzy n=1 Tax=Yersinia aldovae TaxID=29483 RepID=A0ABP1YW54_YERAL|nr:EpsG family protein [Yersinia aldovae]CNL78310.1 Uncharacterised protein [Yersinia aldovae]